MWGEAAIYGQSGKFSLRRCHTSRDLKGQGRGAVRTSGQRGPAGEACQAGAGSQALELNGEDRGWQGTTQLGRG